jgi:hypothetical protein
MASPVSIEKYRRARMFALLYSIPDRWRKGSFSLPSGNQEGEGFHLLLMSLSHCATRGLQEAKRLLRPIGKLIIVEPARTFGEVHNWRQGIARRRFGQYEVIDFLAVLFGYAVSGERTLEEFYKHIPTSGSARLATRATESTARNCAER